MEAAGRCAVDVELKYSGPDHSSCTTDEAGADLLDGGESNSSLAESWVDAEIEDGNEDDESERIKVVDNVVWNAVKRHGSCLRSQVVVKLVVGEPVKREPKEDVASGPATTDLVNPSIVEGHPGWTSRWIPPRWLEVLPKGAIVHVLVCGNWVQMPASLGSFPEELDSRAEDTALWWSEVVDALAEEQHNERGAVDAGWDEVSEPEANVSLCVHHADLPDHSANVDEKVKPVVNSGNGASMVDNDPLAGRKSFDSHLVEFDLLSNQRRDVWLECTSSNAHDDDAD